jgi:hypothetical protein
MTVFGDATMSDEDEASDDRRLCLLCFCPIDHMRPQARFCSDRCRSRSNMQAWRIRHPRPLQRRPGPPRVAPGRQKPERRTKFWIDGDRLYFGRVAYCPRDGCGKKFIDPGTRRKYCSDACKQAAWRNKHRPQPAAEEQPQAPESSDVPAGAPDSAGDDSLIPARPARVVKPVVVKRPPVVIVKAAPKPPDPE